MSTLVTSITSTNAALTVSAPMGAIQLGLTVAGSNTYVLYNSNGGFGGNAGFYTDTSGNVTVNSLMVGPTGSASTTGIVHIKTTSSNFARVILENTGDNVAAISFGSSGETVVSSMNVGTDMVREDGSLEFTSGSYPPSSTCIMYMMPSVTASTSVTTGLLVITSSGGVGVGGDIFARSINAGAPTGGSEGSGTINVASGIYLNGTAYTNPDYVFEHFYNGGKIVRFADKKGASTYKGLVSLNEMEEYISHNLHLPGFGQNAKNDLFSGSEALLANVEEGYLYLFDHERRIVGLERENKKLQEEIARLMAS